jgi:hypothetical protein
MSIFCGSNQLNPKLIANGGNKTIGTRHQCLRKGIGVGLHMPLDITYNQPYQPIDQRKFYCGDRELPPGYYANGTLQQCFSKGVGVGRLKVARRGWAYQNRSWIPFLFFYIILNTAFILGMIYGKPSFILKESKEIDWNILSPYIALFAILTGLVLYYRFSIN